MKIVSEIMLILSNYILLAYTGQGSLQKPPQNARAKVLYQSLCKLI